MTSSAMLISQYISTQNSRHETSREWEHSRVSHDGKLYRMNGENRCRRSLSSLCISIRLNAQLHIIFPLDLWMHRIGKNVSKVLLSYVTSKCSHKQSLWEVTYKAKPGRHSNLILISVCLTYTHDSGPFCPLLIYIHHTSEWPYGN